MDASCGYVVLFALVAWGALYIVYKVKVAKADAALRHADLELQRTQPEVWRQKELLKLEKERLAAQKELAEGQAKQENLRRNVGLIAGIGHGLGWW